MTIDRDEGCPQTGAPDESRSLLAGLDLDHAILYPPPAMTPEDRRRAAKRIGRRGNRYGFLTTHRMFNALSIEAVGIFTAMRVWADLGEDYSDTRVAWECFGGDLDAAHRIIVELDGAGLLVSPEAQAELARVKAAEERDQEERQKAWRAANDHVRYTGRRWSGTWPLDTCAPESTPDGGTPVVYFQFDDAGQLAYIGKTNYFGHRMGDHLKARMSMHWARWTAAEVEGVNVLLMEDAEIERHRPYQNGPPVLAKRRETYVVELPPLSDPLYACSDDEVA